jgi:adenine-specific DNA-methyltransferase
MAKPKKASADKVVTHFAHDADKRKNIPTAELQSLHKDPAAGPKELRYPRNPDLDPQLVWRGKDQQDWSDLVVPTPPLYIQEKVHPKALIDDLLRRSKERSAQADGLFGDLFQDFDGLPKDADKTEFYQHDANWANRMILGDSLQVMASLAEREGLRGKVQCIYFDPPYGITFNSNFQWSTTSRDVQDGQREHITRDPEQVKAFRDTWRDGIHSYLTYLRDRLTVARDLLTDSGSIFVQIGADNVHRVRVLLDEVFGEKNCITEILVKKKGSQKSGTLDPVNDFVLWYSKSEKSSGSVKTRTIFEIREDAEIFEDFPFVQLADGRRLRITELEDLDGKKYTQDISLFRDKYPEAKLFAANPLKSGGHRRQQSLDFNFQGRVFPIKAGQCWKHTVAEDDGSTPGMIRLARAGRLLPLQKDVRFIKHASNPSVREVSNWWDGFGGASNPVYVVQTNERIVERLLLMASDAGDLVLDPTCGSGTTAVVAEQLGRRWITIDTSRVALALARLRIAGARFPYYILADSKDGLEKEAEIENRMPRNVSTFGNLKHGFVYRRVSNVTSGSIANNKEIDVIWERWGQALDSHLARINEALGRNFRELEMPEKADECWPEVAKDLYAEWSRLRHARQAEMDASIAAKAEFEYLYDKPYEDKKKVRVAGPFTVESLTPHRMLTVNEEGDAVDLTESRLGFTAKKNFAELILDNLRTAGVQQAHKEDKINFTSLAPWAGTYVCAEGYYQEGDKAKRVAIFIGPEFGTVQRADLVEAAREAADAKFDALIACAFSYDAHTTDLTKIGSLQVLKARMNADLHMAAALKSTGKGNLFVIFGEPDIDLLTEADGQLRIKIKGVDVFKPQSGKVESSNTDEIACWFIDTDYNSESFFVRHAYFLGANDPYDSLKKTLKAEIDQEAWESLHSDTSRPFPKPKSKRIAVKVINHLGDEVMRVFKVD